MVLKFPLHLALDHVKITAVDRLTVKQAHIANGQSVSSDVLSATNTYGTPGGGIDMAESVLVGIEMPSAWTAASLTLLVSSDGVNYKSARNTNGTEYNPAVDADQIIQVDAHLSLGWRFIKVRSGTGAAAVNQLGDRVVKLLGRQS